MSYDVSVFMPEADEILPGLFLGNMKAALNPRFFDEIKFTHVVSICEPVLSYCQEKDIKYHSVTVDDNDSADMLQHLEPLCKHLDSLLDTKDKKSESCILLHCHEGISRSATVMVAYLLWRENTRGEKPLEVATVIGVVRSKRACVEPREVFVKQLETWRKFLEEKAAFRTTLIQWIVFPARFPGLFRVPCHNHLLVCCRSGRHEACRDVAERIATEAGLALTRVSCREVLLKSLEEKTTKVVERLFSVEKALLLLEEPEVLMDHGEAFKSCVRPALDTSLLPELVVLVLSYVATQEQEEGYFMWVRTEFMGQLDQNTNKRAATVVAVTSYPQVMPGSFLRRFPVKTQAFTGEQHSQNQELLQWVKEYE
jgi:hypothetical protein